MTRPSMRALAALFARNLSLLATFATGLVLAVGGPWWRWAATGAAAIGLAALSTWIRRTAPDAADAHVEPGDHP